MNNFYPNEESAEYARTDFSRYAMLRDTLNNMHVFGFGVDDVQTPIQLSCQFPSSDDPTAPDWFDSGMYVVEFRATAPGRADGRWVVAYSGVEGYICEVDQITGEILA